MTIDLFEEEVREELGGSLTIQHLSARGGPARRVVVRRSPLVVREL